MIKFWRTIGDYGFMSNFSKHSIMINDKKYASCEHYYQSMKATNEVDHESIRLTKGSKNCKNLARQIVLRPDWEDIKYEIMKNALRAKAQQYGFIIPMLIESGTEELVEDSPYDYIWGIGKDGTGQNLLGKAWMEIRDELTGNVSGESDIE